MFDTPQHWHFGDEPKIKWLDIVGFFWPTRFEASNKFMYVSNAEVSKTGAGGTEQTIKTFSLKRQGIIRINFDYKASTTFQGFSLKKNGVVLSTYSVVSANVWYSIPEEDIEVQFGDIITITGSIFNTGDYVYARNLTLGYDVKKVQKDFEILID